MHRMILTLKNGVVITTYGNSEKAKTLVNAIESYVY